MRTLSSIKVEAGVGRHAGEQTADASAGPEITDAAEVLTVPELAAVLRVDKKTAYNLIANGQIPGARRLGRVIRIHRAAVLEWLAQGQDRAPRSRKHK